MAALDFLRKTPPTMKWSTIRRGPAMLAKNHQQGHPAAARVRVPIAGETVLKAVYEDVARLFNSPDRLWQLTPGCERIERMGHRATEAGYALEF
jgi:hypothetical protein